MPLPQRTSMLEQKMAQNWMNAMDTYSDGCAGRDKRRDS